MSVIRSTDRVRVSEGSGYAAGRFTVAVRDDAGWRTVGSFPSYEEARPSANAAHRALRDGGDAADAVIAGLRAVPVPGGWEAAGAAEEFRHGQVNVALGMCPDGCCGGAEVLPEDEWPTWQAWADRLRAAADRA